MSILTDLINKKITFSTATSEAATWIEKTFANDTVASAAAATVLSDFKQAASNAIAMGETALGPILAEAGPVIETTVNALITKATGPVGILLTPAVDASLTTLENAAIAEVSAAFLKARSLMQLPPPNNTEAK